MVHFAMQVDKLTIFMSPYVNLSENCNEAKLGANVLQSKLTIHH